jgi:hypothetical protein
MSLAEMRAFVREHLDSDEDELPNSLLDRFFADGSSRVEGRIRRATFRAVEYTLTTVADQREYDLDAESSLISPAPLASIDAIQGPSYELKPADHRKMRARFPENSDEPSAPVWFTMLGRTLHLWPTPSEVAAYTVMGARQGVDWIATNAAPDFPEQLHELIAWWGLNRAYGFLDDPEMAAFYRDEFDRELRIRASDYTLANDAQPFVLNGGTSPWRAGTRGFRARYDWD